MARSRKRDAPDAKAGLDEATVAFGRELAQRIGRRVMYVDTGAILSVLNAGDPRTVSLIDDELVGTPLVTSSYVVAETARRLIKSKGGTAEFRMQQAIGFLTAWLVDHGVTVLFIPEDVFNAAKRVLQQHHYVGCDLCDAISYLIVRAMNQDQIISSDHHFAQLGLRLLPGQ